MPAGHTVIRRDRTPPARVAQTPGALVRTTPPLVVLIESSPQVRAAIGQLLTDWSLPVLEAELDGETPVRDDYSKAAAIITDFELGAGLDRPPPYNGLDIALLIARRAGRGIPILVTSDNFGRHAIPACSPHRIPVMFKPVAPEFLRGWLVAAALLTDSPPWPRLNGQVRTAA